MADRAAAPEHADPLTVAGDLRVVVQQLSRRLREQTSVGDFTRSQESVLIRLERDGPATMTALARAEGVRPQSMGVTVATLLEAGWITGAPDAADGRKTVLSLTDGAREQFASGRLAKADWLFRAIRARLTPAEQDELSSCVEFLKRLASFE
jgi:DNA-binding MarR family transcriptional regulator